MSHERQGSGYDSGAVGYERLGRDAADRIAVAIAGARLGPKFAKLSNVRLRMSFRRWSQAVDRDGLFDARGWLERICEKLEATTAEAEAATIDLLCYGRAVIGADGKRVDPLLFMTNASSAHSWPERLFLDPPVEPPSVTMRIGQIKEELAAAMYAPLLPAKSQRFTATEALERMRQAQTPKRWKGE